MNPVQVLRSLELAAHEMAEAETHERAARALRLRATKRTSSVHAELAAALKTALNIPRPATDHTTPSDPATSCQQP